MYPLSTATECKLLLSAFGDIIKFLITVIVANIHLNAPYGTFIYISQGTDLKKKTTFNFLRATHHLSEDNMTNGTSL